MAFLRFTRDKRGYEHFYLVEATTNRRGKTKARVLYWFRTPPGVKVGREPFDPDVRRALELQNPGVHFDWRKIVETPIPSADAERWRERRRLERTERVGRRGVGPGDVQRPQESRDVLDALDGAPDIESSESGDLTVDAAEQQADALAPTEESLVSAAASIEPDEPLSDGRAPDGAPEGQAVSGAGNAQLSPVGAETHEFRRRRRRRRRRGRGQGGSPPTRGE